MKLRMARTSSQGAWLTSKAHGKTELNVNRLTATLFCNFGARLQQATAGYKFNQGMYGYSMTCITKHPQ